jgi:hypothetical protein
LRWAFFQALELKTLDVDMVAERHLKSWHTSWFQDLEKIVKYYRISNMRNPNILKGIINIKAWMICCSLGDVK